MNQGPRIGTVATATHSAITLWTASDASRLLIGDVVSFWRDGKRLKPTGIVSRVDGRTGVVYTTEPLALTPADRDVVHLVSRADPTTKRSTDDPNRLRLEIDPTSMMIDNINLRAQEIRLNNQRWPQTMHVSVPDFFRYARQSGGIGLSGNHLQVITPGGCVTLVSDPLVDEGDLILGYENFDLIRAQETFELCERTAVALMERAAELKKLIEAKS